MDERVFAVFPGPHVRDPRPPRLGFAQGGRDEAHLALPGDGEGEEPLVRPFVQAVQVAHRDGRPREEGVDAGPLPARRRGRRCGRSAWGELTCSGVTRHALEGVTGHAATIRGALLPGNNDLYTYTVKRVVWERFPHLEVEYAFKNRDGTDLRPFIPRVREKLQELHGLAPTPGEIQKLRETGFLAEPFLEALAQFRLSADHVEVGERDGRLRPAHPGAVVPDDRPGGARAPDRERGVLRVDGRARGAGGGRPAAGGEDRAAPRGRPRGERRRRGRSLFA